MIQNHQKLGGNIGDSESTFIEDFKNIKKKYVFHLLVNSRGGWTKYFKVMYLFCAGALQKNRRLSHIWKNIAGKFNGV